MDTIPFHFLMFALDLVLILGFAYWPAQRSMIRAALGWMLFSTVGLFGIAFFAVLFRSNLGQCAVEGVTYHGSAFLVVAGMILIWKKRRLLAVPSILLGLLLFGIGLDMLLLEPYRLVVERYTIETAKLEKPLRIVFVADIQTDRIGRHERKTLETIRRQNADLILLGGDYLQYYPGSYGAGEIPERFRNLLLDVPLSAPLGVFAINGNIDPQSVDEFAALFKDTTVEPVYYSEIIEDLGVDKGLGPIDLALLSMVDSIDGVGRRGLTETGNFLVMAGHYPNYAIKDYRDKERSPDLMLAGHTHGGQVALPGYGPVRIKYTGREAIIGREYLRGLKTFSGGKLLISRGSGMERGWAPRVRFFCPPEISVIDLIPAKIDPEN